MRLIFRVSSIAGPYSDLSRLRSRVRASFSRVHLAQKLAPERTASGRFSFPPDDDEEFRGGRGKRVNRHLAFADRAGFIQHVDRPTAQGTDRRPSLPCHQHRKFLMPWDESLRLALAPRPSGPMACVRYLQQFRPHIRAISVRIVRQRGDDLKHRFQHQLRGYILFAIRKAAKWTVVAPDELPSVAAFIADVRLAIGTGVLERRRLLSRLV